MTTRDPQNLAETGTHPSFGVGVLDFMIGKNTMITYNNDGSITTAPHTIRGTAKRAHNKWAAYRYEKYLGTFETRELAAKAFEMAHHMYPLNIKNDNKSVFEKVN